MSDTEDIEKRIVQIIIRDLELNIRKDDILPAGRLDELFGMDSIAILELVVGLEKEFDIKIPDEYLTIETFQSIKTIAGHVCRLMQNRGHETFH
jgi:acyl carrier protein